MAFRRSADPDSRERLLQAGLAIARERGLRALTVRAVAARAQANLGSFVYHFRTRDTFVAELIERLYAPMMATLELDATHSTDPVANLRRTVLDFVAWVAAQREFLAHLLLDAGAGEPGAMDFVRTLDQRHPALLLRLVAQCQAAGRIEAGAPLHALMFLMTTLAAPVLVFHMLGQHALAPPALAQNLAGYALDPALIRQRLDWALRGLAPVDRDTSR